MPPNPSPLVNRIIRVGLINTYLQGREVLISSGEYPAHHLWGVDLLPPDSVHDTIIPHSGSASINRFCSWITKITRLRFGDLDQELEV